MKKLLASFLAVQMMFSMTVFAENLSPYFSDIDTNQYRDSIDFLHEEGAVNGYGDGTFRPDDLVNRAEMLKILLEAGYYHIEEEQGAPSLEKYADDYCFEDVPVNAWYTKYVCYAKANGWVRGYHDGFRPNDEVNLIEALKMMMVVFDYEQAEGDIWYKSYVDQAAVMNLIPLSFRGFEQEVTRAEMADMVTRMLLYLEGKQRAFYGDAVDFRISYETLKNGEEPLLLEEFETMRPRDRITPASAEALYNYVCGEGYGTECLQSKQDVFGCEFAEIVNYGKYDFVMCLATYDPDETYLLPATGGMAYNLLAWDPYTEGKVLTMKDQFEVINYWESVESEKEAMDLIMALGLSEADPTQDDLQDLKDLVVAGEGDLDYLSWTDGFEDSTWESTTMYDDGSYGVTAFVYFDYNQYKDYDGFNCSEAGLFQYDLTVTPEADYYINDSMRIATVDYGQCTLEISE